MHLSMLSPTDFSEEYLVKIPTVGPQNLVKSDQISPGVRSIYIEDEFLPLLLFYEFLPLFKTVVFQGFTKAPKAALLQFQDGRCSSCPFRIWLIPFSRHIKKFLTINKYLCAKEKRGLSK